MRTTIDIDDEVMRKIKQVAAESGRLLREVIEDALRSDLARRENRSNSAAAEALITFRGNGLRPGINLDSTADLIDAMDGLT